MASPAPVRTIARHSAGVRSAPRPAVGPGPAAAPRAGHYRLDPRTATWEWSPEMFELLGLQPGATRPSTETLLRYQHAEDRARTLAAVDRAVTTGRAFAVEIRLLRRDGLVRAVVLTGEPRLSADGGVIALEGTCIDVTDGRLTDGDGAVSALHTEIAQLRTAMASRATIEQAKGVLMVLTGCGEQVAFELLAHMSSHTHRKVREVAQTIVESASGHASLPADVRAILRDACPPAPPTG